jgi:hypothetical protein
MGSVLEGRDLISGRGKIFLLSTASDRLWGFSSDALGTGM